MIRDKFSRRSYTENELFDIIYKNPTCDLSQALLDNPTQHNNAVDVNFSSLSKFIDDAVGIEPEAWHKKNQSNWHMPDQYKNMDIAAWVLDQCNGEAELQRCGTELLEYASRDLLPLLQYIKYLVDLMTTHKIVWGVGRGSSVSSFVLYKIGIHKINSLYYDLPLEEFFKNLTKS